MSVSTEIARAALSGATQLAVSSLFPHGDPDTEGARMCLAEAGYDVECISYDSRSCRLVARVLISGPKELAVLAALEHALVLWRGEIVVARIPLLAFHLVAPSGAWQSLTAAFGDTPHWQAIADLWEQGSRASVLPAIQRAMRQVAAAGEDGPGASLVEILFAG